MHKLLLLVEDNPTDEKLAVEALKRSGVDDIEVVIARDGAEAVERLIGKDPMQRLPDLVLLDLSLPRMSGFDVLARLRGNERTRHLPVVILTASQEDEDMKRGYAAGANAYVRKPVDFSEFVRAARTLGVFWLSLNQQPQGDD